MKTPAHAERPRSLTAIVAPVALAGVALAAAVVASLIHAPPGLGYLAGALVFLVAATVAEAFPVPLAGVSEGGVSIAASFLVASAVIQDWRAAVLLGLACRLILELQGRRPLVRLAYNSAVYALAAGAAGGIVALVGDTGTALALVAAVVGGSAAFYATNLLLIALVIARSSGTRVDRVLLEGARWTVVPFAIMASVSLMLEVLWSRTPGLSLALAGPLLAVALYQRSIHRSLEAMRLAKTDPLTGLGNSRAFDEKVAELLGQGEPFAVCLVDLDGFKRVNDEHGHQAGDAVLASVAGHLAATGHGFRLGGDELALVLPTDDPAPAAQRVCEAVVATAHDLPIRSTVSIGYARFPADGLDHGRLVACADAALYHAKRLGKNRVCGYEVRAVETTAIESTPLLTRVRALWQLTEIVDAVDGDGSGNGHSRRVADVAVELAQALRVPDDEVELIRLAARLHDLGKLTVPVEILGKSGALADVEWRAVREHPEIGRRILSSLGAGEIADWVLHQHEWWDGRGYPSGLAGEEIPRASRIIFVADAYDAMTNDRPFQAALDPDLALAEIERCSSTQFDPEVVAALLDVRGGRLPIAAAG